MKRFSWGLGPSKWGERILGAFKYILAVGMMVSGVLTPFNGAVDPGGSWIYSSVVALTIYGIIFFLAGLWLFVGKIRKSRHQTGQGLMAIFCCFIFAISMNASVVGWEALAGSNMVVCVIVGLLYLRWRFKTAYMNPDHFIDDAQQGPRTFEHH